MYLLEKFYGTNSNSCDFVDGFYYQWNIDIFESNEGCSHGWSYGKSLRELQHNKKKRKKVMSTSDVKIPKNIDGRWSSNVRWRKWVYHSTGNKVRRADDENISFSKPNSSSFMEMKSMRRRTSKQSLLTRCDSSTFVVKNSEDKTFHWTKSTCSNQLGCGTKKVNKIRDSDENLVDMEKRLNLISIDDGAIDENLHKLGRGIDRLSGASLAIRDELEISKYRIDQVEQRMAHANVKAVTVNARARDEIIRS